MTRDTHTAFHSAPYLSLLRLLLCGALVSLVTSMTSAYAHQPLFFDDCSTVQEDALTECLQSALQDQRDTIAKLERRLRGQEITLRELREQLRLRRPRRSSNTQIADPPPYMPAPPVVLTPPPTLGFGSPFGLGYGGYRGYGRFGALPFRRFPPISLWID